MPHSSAIQLIVEAVVRTPISGNVSHFNTPFFFDKGITQLSLIVDCVATRAGAYYRRLSCLGRWNLIISKSVRLTLCFSLAPLLTSDEFPPMRHPSRPKVKSQCALLHLRMFSVDLPPARFTTIRQAYGVFYVAVTWWLTVPSTWPLR
jgi:hypothetical protein